MSGTSSDDGEAWSHARHLIYYVGMRYRSVVICKDIAVILTCAVYEVVSNVIYTRIRDDRQTAGGESKT